MENNLKEIQEFIKQWKERAINYYTEKITYYHQEYRRKNSYLCDYHNNKYSIMKERNLTEEEYREEYRQLEDDYQEFKEEMREEITQRFSQDVYWYRLDECLNRMIKTIEKDAIIKEQQLIKRVNKEVGTIEKAITLKVGVNGELNGLIQGENGKCKIETIYAGGYNIQCLHYRVLIHKIKG